MKDFYDYELWIGDSVEFTTPWQDSVETGFVIEFVDKFARIGNKYPNPTMTTLCESTQIKKIWPEK